jgi:HPt (histidine-containing phosphotransfer) domain-containing protein
MAQILNEATYLELKCLMDQDFDLLLQTFHESSIDSIAAIQAAAQQADFERLRLCAHTFKSSSACLGAEQLAQLCKEMEAASLKRDVGQLETFLAELEVAYSALVTTLEGC